MLDTTGPYSPSTWIRTRLTSADPVGRSEGTGDSRQLGIVRKAAADVPGPARLNYDCQPVFR
jgi:hypothetical protein